MRPRSPGTPVAWIHVDACVVRAFTAFRTTPIQRRLFFWFAERYWSDMGPRPDGTRGEPRIVPVDLAALTKELNEDLVEVVTAWQWLRRARILRQVRGGVVINSKFSSWLKPECGCRLLGYNDMCWLVQPFPAGNA